MEKKMKRYKKFLRRGAIVTFLLIIVGVLFTSESICPKITPSSSFDNDDILTKEDIDIKLDSYFYNSYKLGLSFRLKLDDVKLLMNKDFESVFLYYSIKNGNGEYIEDISVSNKPAMNNNNSSYVFQHSTEVLCLEKGEVQYDVLFEFASGDIPKLENAEIDIENVSLIYKNNSEDGLNRNSFYYKYYHKQIEGNWNLALSDSNQKEIKTTEYLQQDNKANINVIYAKISNTSFNISISLKDKLNLLKLNSSS